ncbi:hypothetical protein QN391_25585, partial [Pseudomonas sp. CCI1.2]|uniref:hypothetical protein n=2 Tax=Pseudomonas sp. CCI1.2 TaxID=3048614 RepID=UPI002B2223B7
MDTYTAKAGEFTGQETISVASSMTDAAGNTGNATLSGLIIDTTAPVVAIATVAAGGSFNAGFTVTEGATVFVNVDTNILTPDQLLTAFTMTNAGGLDTYTAKSNAYIGSETISVTASLADGAGNTGNAASTSLTIDTTAPDATISQVDATGSAGAAFAAGFSVIAGATVVVTVNSTELDLSSFADHFSITTADGVDTYTAKTGEFTGQETISVASSMTDAAGNTGNATLSGLIIDTTAPVVAIATVAAGGSFDAGFTVTEGATVFVNVDTNILTPDQLLTAFTMTNAGGLDTYTAKSNAY